MVAVALAICLGRDSRCLQNALKAPRLGSCIRIAGKIQDEERRYPGLRSLIIDPYGYVMAASHFQKEGAIFVEIDFDQKKVYYSGRKAKQRKPGKSGVGSYVNGDIPQQHLGWRDMIFTRRRPELY